MLTYADVSVGIAAEAQRNSRFTCASAEHHRFFIFSIFPIFFYVLFGFTCASQVDHFRGTDSELFSIFFYFFSNFFSPVPLKWTTGSSYISRLLQKKENERFRLRFTSKLSLKRGLDGDLVRGALFLKLASSH